MKLNKKNQSKEPVDSALFKQNVSSSDLKKTFLVSDESKIDFGLAEKTNLNKPETSTISNGSPSPKFIPNNQLKIEPKTSQTSLSHNSTPSGITSNKLSVPETLNINKELMGSLEKNADESEIFQNKNPQRKLERNQTDNVLIKSSKSAKFSGFNKETVASVQLYSKNKSSLQPSIKKKEKNEPQPVYKNAKSPSQAKIEVNPNFEDSGKLKTSKTLKTNEPETRLIEKQANQNFANKDTASKDFLNSLQANRRFSLVAFDNLKSEYQEKCFSPNQYDPNFSKNGLPEFNKELLEAIQSNPHFINASSTWLRIAKRRDSFSNTESMNADYQKGLDSYQRNSIYNSPESEGFRKNLENEPESHPEPDNLYEDKGDDEGSAETTQNPKPSSLNQDPAKNSKMFEFEFQKFDGNQLENNGKKDIQRTKKTSKTVKEPNFTQELFESLQRNPHFVETKKSGFKPLTQTIKRKNNPGKANEAKKEVSEPVSPLLTAGYKAKNTENPENINISEGTNEKNSQITEFCKELMECLQSSPRLSPSEKLPSSKSTKKDQTTEKGGKTSTKTDLTKDLYDSIRSNPHFATNTESSALKQVKKEVSNFPEEKVQIRPKTTLKIPNINKILNSVQSNPGSSATSPHKYIRKDSRSHTELNTPIEINHIVQIKEETKSVQFNRRMTRNKTEIILPNKSSKNYLQPKVFEEEKLQKAKFLPNEALYNNFKIEKTPTRISQKERFLHETPFTIPELPEDKDYKNFQNPDECKNMYQSNEDKMDELMKLNNIAKIRRSSVTSNASMNSAFLSEAHNDALYELTRSLKELNQRLIQNEEITFNRTKENSILQKTIQNLENKIDEQKSLRVDRDGINVGCTTGGCLIF